jgi:tetratricopeptide (TPR) repeat protein
MDDDVKQWQKEERRRIAGRIIRWCFGVPLLFSYPWLGWISPFLVTLGAILIVPEVAGYFSKLVTNLIWPSGPLERKPLYSIPESLVARGKYAEAEQEYEKIIQEFPNEVKPHADMIDVAIRRLNNVELAEQLYQRGMSLLQQPADREVLTKMYAAIRSRLKNRKLEPVKAVSSEKFREIQERVERERQQRWR